MNIKFIALFILLFSLASCSIESTMHFNRDFSGSSSTSIDLSQMQSFASAFSEEGDDTSMDSLLIMLDEDHMPDSLRQKLDSMKNAFHNLGFEDFTVTPENEALTMSFNFDDVSVFDPENISKRINEMNKMESDATEDFTKDDFSALLQTTSIERDGKWLYFDLTSSMGSFKDKLQQDLGNYDSENLSEEEKQKEDTSEKFAAGMMAGFMNMFEIKQTITFDRKIKKIDCPLPYTSEKRSITLDYTFGDLIQLMKESKGEKVELKIRLR